MTAEGEYCLIMTTTDDRSEAQSLAQGLVERRLAACVQIADIFSYYRWEEGVSNADEFMLFIKTAEDQFEAVKGYLNEAHSYDVPELVELPIQRGSAAYLGWIRESTTGRQDEDQGRPTG
jgi:periplasmic divalent cation tolerance protein